MNEGSDGDSEQCVSAEEPAHDDHAGDGGEDNGAKDARAPASDDFFDDEEDGGDWGIEGSGEAGGGADGSQQAQLLAREFEPAAERRGERGSDLEGRIFGTEGLSGADGEGGANELADGVLEWDIAVVDVERGFRLIDAAAADFRKKVKNENGDEQADGGRGSDDADSAGMGQRTHERDAAPVDGDAENQEEALFLEAGVEGKTG